MNIIKRIKQRAQRQIEKRQIAKNARLYKEIEISKTYSAFSLAQIKDLIAYEEQELARMSIFNFRRKYQSVLVAGMHRAKRLIKARKESLERQSTIANAPKIKLERKLAA